MSALWQVFGLVFSFLKRTAAAQLPIVNGIPCDPVFSGGLPPCGVAFQSGNGNYFFNFVIVISSFELYFLLNIYR